MARKVVVIGAGPGGYVAAVRAAQLGGEVCVIERDNAGGTCLNRGCIPSKVMVTAADLLEKCRRAREFGLRLEGSVSVDMEQLMARKARVIQDQVKGILDLFARNRITFLRGEGTVVGPGTAGIRQADGTSRQVEWDSLILAHGTRPLEFPAFPFDGEHILSSDDVLSLRDVPASIMILGGGVIGCEFACMLAALGSRVTLVEALDRLLPLPSVDEDCSKVLQREMKKRKIRFLLSRTVEGVEQTDGKLRVTLGPSPLVPDAKGQTASTEEVDKLVVCVGRRANTEGLGLETLDVAVDGRGWVVADDRMETGVHGVFVIGDALGPSRIMLAHVASAEGLVAAENAVGGNAVMKYDAVPGAIFTSPEVANVGLTEVRAREQGYSVRCETVLFRTLGKAQVIGEIAGEAKLVSDAATGRILGVHIIGPHATDLIAEGTLAVKMGATVRDLAETIHAHPTLPEVMLETSLKFVHGA